MHPVYKKDPVHIGLIKIHLIYCIHFFKVIFLIL
jgi:hypothetical protein